MAISNFTRHEQLLEPNGLLTLRGSEFFRILVRNVNLNTPITGIGSPEGVIAAEPTQRYMDTTGAAGSILYIKQTGVGNTGWILV